MLISFLVLLIGITGSLYFSIQSNQPLRNTTLQLQCVSPEAFEVPPVEVDGLSLLIMMTIWLDLLPCCSFYFAPPEPSAGFSPKLFSAHLKRLLWMASRAPFSFYKVPSYNVALLYHYWLLFIKTRQLNLLVSLLSLTGQDSYRFGICNKVSIKTSLI